MRRRSSQTGSYTLKELARKAVRIDRRFRCFRRFVSAILAVVGIIRRHIDRHLNAMDRTVWSTLRGPHLCQAHSVPTALVGAPRFQEPGSLLLRAAALTPPKAGVRKLAKL